MAATKNSRTIQASTSVAAAGTQNGTELNLSTAYGALVCGKVTNGATGPTVACSMYVYVGESTGTKRLFAKCVADTGNNIVTELIVEIPPAAMFVNVTFKDHTAQAVTVECYAQELTTI